MAYKAVTDNAVFRFYNQSNPKSRSITKELLNNNTGYNVIVDNNGFERELSEPTVKSTIVTAELLNDKAKPKAKPASNRTTTTNDF